MTFDEINEKVKKVWVVRNNKRVKVKKTDKEGYFINSKGKEEKRKASDSIALGRIQKRASLKRKSGKASSNRKRALSLKKSR